MLSTVLFIVRLRIRNGIDHLLNYRCSVYALNYKAGCAETE